MIRQLFENIALFSVLTLPIWIPRWSEQTKDLVADGIRHFFFVLALFTIVFILPFWIATAAGAAVIPLSCANPAYHWGSITGQPDALYYTQVSDCEWNHVSDDYGSNDTDASDPTDFNVIESGATRFFWNYRVTTSDLDPPAGLWEATNFVWSPDDSEVQTWTWSGDGLPFDVTEGTVYHTRVDHAEGMLSDGVTPCVTDALAFFYVYCPSSGGTPVATWYSWSGDPLPSFTAAATETCKVDMRNAAFRNGTQRDPSISWPNCYATDVFRVYTSTNGGGGGGGCGVGPELAAILPLLWRARKWRRA